MDEVRRRVRAGARTLAALRNLVLHLIYARGPSVTEPREKRAHAIAVLTGQILRTAHHLG